MGGAHRLLAETWRPGGGGSGEAAPRELETCSGRCREPWRRNLLVPPCATGRRGKGEDVLTRLMGVEPMPCSCFAGVEQK